MLSRRSLVQLPASRSQQSVFTADTASYQPAQSGIDLIGKEAASICFLPASNQTSRSSCHSLFKLLLSVIARPSFELTSVIPHLDENRIESPGALAYHACTLSKLRKLSILLDTSALEEQYQLEVSLFAARLPLLSPLAVSLRDRLRIVRQQGRTY